MGISGGTGTIASNGASVQFANTDQGTTLFSITGTWSGTLAFQFSLDGGNTWYTQLAQVVSSGLFTGRASVTTSNGVYAISDQPIPLVQVVATAWSSGTATVAWYTSATTLPTNTSSTPTVLGSSKGFSGIQGTVTDIITSGFPHFLYGYKFTGATTGCFLQLFDAAAANVTLGSTAPKIAIVTDTSNVEPFISQQIALVQFSTGLSAAYTTGPTNSTAAGSALSGTLWIN